ncbi:MAG: hypothetical protein JSW65_07290 [Candidatus Bipolaricaulota bacterium]|nr:MAG: hypothetical protein JSW65_07290 [Candidatus Bipolaricaulota bacterium]
MHYSPSLALATAAFEIAVALWLLSWVHAIPTRLRSRRSTMYDRALGRAAADRAALHTTAAILLLLGGYQMAEVAICASPAASGFLPRLAFLIVTWLPPLGLLLIAQIHEPRSRRFHGPAYGMLAAAAGVTGWILLDPGFASASACNAVFAHYTHAMPRFLAYAVFYWTGLLGMIVLSAWSASRLSDARRRRMSQYILGGTVAFVVPSLVVTQYVPPARGALPSIMCHFALLLAVSLTRMVYIEWQWCHRDVTSAVADT